VTREEGIHGKGAAAVDDRLEGWPGVEPDEVRLVTLRQGRRQFQVRWRCPSGIAMNKDRPIRHGLSSI
jgi:hypothetical protein